MQKDTTFEEIQIELKTDIRLTRIILFSFAILALFVKLFFKAPISFSIIFILFIWFLLYFFYDWRIKKKKNGKDLLNTYFQNNIIDLLILTLIIHYLGGVEWIGAIFYMITLALAGTILPKRKTIFLCLIASFFYSGLVLLEYFQILPHSVLFKLSSGLYQSPSFVFTQILTVIAFFYFIGESVGTFAGKLSEKIMELAKEREKVVKAYEKIGEAKTVLEIKVAARTKELKDLAKSLEDQVKQRTKELQEKMEELGKFNKLAVGRELKMIELKEEIQKLKEELEKYKGRT